MPGTATRVQYVKICSLHGDGFYYIPGTDTCVKLGGYLRVQVEYNAGAGGTAAGSGSTEAAQARFARDVTNDFNHRTRAALSWDVRQETEYGTLRTYIRFGVQVTTPVDSQAGVGFWNRAFMQFAGFTVGRSQSLFDLFTYDGAYSYHTVTVGGDTSATGITYGPIPPSSATASPARCRSRIRRVTIAPRPWTQAQRLSPSMPR